MKLCYVKNPWSFMDRFTQVFFLPIAIYTNFIHLSKKVLSMATKVYERAPALRITLHSIMVA